MEQSQTQFTEVFDFYPAEFQDEVSPCDFVDRVISGFHPNCGQEHEKNFCDGTANMHAANNMQTTLTSPELDLYYIPEENLKKELSIYECDTNPSSDLNDILNQPHQQYGLPPFHHTFSRDINSEFVDQSAFMCRKGKRGAKNVLLWKFILEQLRNGNESVRWVNLLHGSFKFVDTTNISREWGEKKRKKDMNFEKLSRGIRHYYKTGFMSREDGTRLVYRFHWSKVPKAWRPEQVQMEFDRHRYYFP